MFKDKFMNLVKLKDIVGEYVWYMLFGSLVIAVGYNYIIASTCSLQSKILKQARQYEEDRKNDKKEEDNQVKTIYVTINYNRYKNYKTMIIYKYYFISNIYKYMSMFQNYKN